MIEENLVFVAQIEEIGPISEDGKRRQTIQLKNVAVMSGFLFTERDGFVKITVEKMETKKPEKPEEQGGGG